MIDRLWPGNSSAREEEANDDNLHADKTDDGPLPVLGHRARWKEADSEIEIEAHPTSGSVSFATTESSPWNSSKSPVDPASPVSEPLQRFVTPTLPSVLMLFGRAVYQLSLAHPFRDLVDRVIKDPLARRDGSKSAGIDESVRGCPLCTLLLFFLSFLTH